MHKVRSIIANEITDSVGKGEGVTKVSAGCIYCS